MYQYTVYAYDDLDDFTERFLVKLDTNNHVLSITRQYQYHQTIKEYKDKNLLMLCVVFYLMSFSSFRDIETYVENRYHQYYELSDILENLEKNSLYFPNNKKFQFPTNK